jgi:hypothetical protein
MGPLLAAFMIGFPAKQSSFPEVLPPRKFIAASSSDALNHLKHLGLVSVPSGLERMPTTRYESAVATHSAWANVIGILALLEHGDGSSVDEFRRVEPFQKELPTAVVEIVKLIDEYRHELLRLGADCDAMLGDAKTLSGRLKASLTERYVKSGAAQRPPPAWALAAIARLKSDGLLVGYPDGLSGRLRPASRYECTIMVHACTANLEEIVPELSKDWEAQNSQMTNEILEAKKFLGRDIADLLRLNEEFYFEMVKLDGSPEQVAGTLETARYRLNTLEIPKPRQGFFSDVPANHWAAAAVDELAKAGILVGYAGRRFGG